MTTPVATPSQGEKARLANTPWRGLPIASIVQKHARQAAARRQMSEFELSTGITIEEFERQQAQMRADVLSGANVKKG